MRVLAGVRAKARIRNQWPTVPVMPANSSKRMVCQSLTCTHTSSPRSRARSCSRSVRRRSSNSAMLAVALGTDPIRVGCTDAQQDVWLNRIAEEGLIVAYGYSMEVFMAWYSASHWEYFMMWNRMFGQYAWSYWTLIAMVLTETVNGAFGVAELIIFND